MAVFDLTASPYWEHTRYLTYAVPAEHSGADVGTLLRRGL